MESKTLTENGWIETKKKTLLTMATLFFLLAVAVVAHQYFYWGVAFELSDIHHETFMVAFICVAFTLLYLADNLWMRRRKT